MGTRGERVLVPRAFLDVVTKGVNARVIPRTCHRDTGALLDHTTSTSYRPTERVAALVRQRDGRCRFPGCQVNARFCDLDHVRPWPTGPTAARNLICLCRRHHRIKQRLGWRVRLHPDGTLTWTDPTHRTRTTHPVNALASLVLPAAGPDPASAPTHGCTARGLVDSVTAASPASTVVTASPVTTASPATWRTTDRFSVLEFTLEHALAGLTLADHVRRAELRHIPRACTTGHHGRLRIDLHGPRNEDSGTTEPGSGTTPIVLGDDGERRPPHRTGPHRRHHDHGREGDDPPSTTTHRSDPGRADAGTRVGMKPKPERRTRPGLPRSSSYAPLSTLPPTVAMGSPPHVGPRQPVDNRWTPVISPLLRRTMDDAAPAAHTQAQHP